MNLIRNESTNDRLLALEKQMKILSASKGCVDTGSPSNYDEMSDKLIADSVILVRKTAEPREKKPYFPNGKNHASYVFRWPYHILLYNYKFIQIMHGDSCNDKSIN